MKEDTIIIASYPTIEERYAFIDGFEKGKKWQKEREKKRIDEAYKLGLKFRDEILAMIDKDKE